MSTHRQLAAIMFTDIVGYTAMMQHDEQLAVVTVRRHEEVLEKTVPAHEGIVHAYRGDGSLSLFNSATEAVRCAIEIQRLYRQEPVVPLRIGIHIGEIRVEDDKLFGDGVNVASRIESMGQAGTVLISEDVCQKIRNNPDFVAEPVGRFDFKNVDDPMRIYSMVADGLARFDKETVSGKFKEFSAGQMRSGSILARRAIQIPAAAAILVAGFFLYQGIKNRAQTASTEAQPLHSIVVLPFDNLSDDAEQEYFADGITDEVRSQLLSVKNLKVISRSSSVHYKDQNLSLKKIGDELNVAYVLEGNVQRSSDLLKISVQLSNTATDQLEWSPPPFERRIEDLFSVQNEIARQIADQLEVQLTDQESANLDRIPTRSMEAWDAYQRGQALLQRGGGRLETLHEAVTLFEEATRLDPEFARAYAGLADAYLEHIFWGRAEPRSVVQKALSAALRALELDENSGESYGALGAINFYLYQHEPARNYLERAIELSPNYSVAYERLAWIYVFDGDIEGAIRLLRKASDLDPLSTKYLANIGHAYYYAREYRKALDVLSDALLKHPTDNFLLWGLGQTYIALGDYDKAIRAFRSRSAGTETNWLLGYGYAMAGRRAEARKILDLHLEWRKSRYVPAYMIATLYMGLGEQEKALDWLERDYEEGGQGLMFWGLKSDKRFDPISHHPRFTALLARIQ